MLTFDNPGAGCSPALTGPLSIREMAHCVLRLLDQLGVERASVIGRSMGGMIAPELALLAPERIQRLVLVSTAARVDGHLPEVFRLGARMAGTGLRRARCARSAPCAAHLPYLECPGTFARIVLGTLNSEAKP